MKRFEYYAPENLAEALALRREQPASVPLAGGTNLIVQAKEGQRTFAGLISLRRLSELILYPSPIAGGQPDGLTFGSLTSIARLAAHEQLRQNYTALWEACNLLGSVQTRNLATLGGNLCNASPAAETAAPLLVFQARVSLQNADRTRQLPLPAFFTGPGSTALLPDELLTAIHLPPLPARTGSAYRRFTPRFGMDVAVASAAALLTLTADGRIQQAALALGGVAPTPLLAQKAVAILPGERPTAALFRQSAQIAAQECEPIDDVRASATFRRHLVSVLVEQALHAAAQQAAAESSQ